MAISRSFCEGCVVCGCFIISWISKLSSSGDTSGRTGRSGEVAADIPTVDQDKDIELPLIT